MKTITAIGVDLAKSVFHVCGVNKAERVVLSRKYSRTQFLKEIHNFPKCKIFMEACGSAHFWARKLQSLGHEVFLIAGQHVKKFVRGNKSDAIDAEAIVTAGLRPQTRFVPIKSEHQLEVQMLHRVRTKAVKQRTATSNEIRSFLYEQGIVIPCGIVKLKKQSLEILSEARLSPFSQEILRDLLTELERAEEIIDGYEERIAREAKGIDVIKRLMTIPGVGVLTASAMANEIADPYLFKNGRELAAFLGLVPSHSGSGGKVVNHGISKRGDTYLRTLLIHGARSIMRFTATREDRVSVWCEKLRKRAGNNKAAVALANKNARIIWKILVSDEVYKAAKAA